MIATKLPSQLVPAGIRIWLPLFCVLWWKNNSTDFSMQVQMFWLIPIFFTLGWYCCLVPCLFAAVFLSNLDTMQLHLRFGRLPFWLSRVDQRLPNTTVVHIYFLFYDIFPPNPLFFSSANHQSILGKTRLLQWVAKFVSCCRQYIFCEQKYILIGQMWEGNIEF